MSIAEAIFNVTLIIIAVVTCQGGDPLKEPHRVTVCLVASGPEAEDLTTNLWSDQVEKFFERYPGSYCGPCGEPRTCPEEN